MGRIVENKYLIRDSILLFSSLQSLMICWLCEIFLKTMDIVYRGIRSSQTTITAFTKGKIMDIFLIEWKKKKKLVGIWKLVIELTRTRWQLNWLVQPLKNGRPHFESQTGLIHFIGGGIVYLQFSLGPIKWG